MRTPDEVDRIVAAFVATAKPWLRLLITGEEVLEFAKDTCIRSTAITVDVFRHFGVPATPFPVAMDVFNAKFMALVERHGRFPTTPEELRHWTDDLGGWSVGVGRGSGDPGSWAGHLTAVVDRRFLIDPTADQADRPQHKIKLPDILVVRVSEPFLSGEMGVMRGNVGPCMVMYDAQPMNYGFTTSKDWQLVERRTKAVQGIVRSMQEYLDKETTRDHRHH